MQFQQDVQKPANERNFKLLFAVFEAEIFENDQ